MLEMKANDVENMKISKIRKYVFMLGKRLKMLMGMVFVIYVF